MLTTRGRRRSPSRCRAPRILTLVLAASTLGVISFALHWRRALASQLPPPPPPLSVSPRQRKPLSVSPPLSTSLTPRRPPPHVDTPGAYVLVSFKNGAVLGDGLRLLVSRDARRWHALPNEPLVLPLAETGGTVFRDPSILWWHGAFHLVWSSDLCVGQVPGKWKCKGAPAAEADHSHTRPLPQTDGARCSMAQASRARSDRPRASATRARPISSIGATCISSRSSCEMHASMLIDQTRRPGSGRAGHLGTARGALRCGHGGPLRAPELRPIGAGSTGSPPGSPTPTSRAARERGDD